MGCAEPPISVLELTKNEVGGGGSLSRTERAVATPGLDAAHWPRHSRKRYVGIWPCCSNKLIPGCHRKVDRRRPKEVGKGCLHTYKSGSVSTRKSTYTTM